MIFEAHMNVLIDNKDKILMLVKWSYLKSPDYIEPWMIIIIMNT